MTTVALGPYEHPGAYGERAESEVFDTSGVGSGFCKHCEHMPCVAGASPYCTGDPRFITVEAVRAEIDDLRWKVAEYGHPFWAPLNAALGGLSTLAWTRGPDGDYALARLVTIRAELRRSAQEQS